MSNNFKIINFDKIKKRKHVLFLVFILCMGASCVIWSSNSSPYTATAVVQVGRIYLPEHDEYRRTAWLAEIVQIDELLTGVETASSVAEALRDEDLKQSLLARRFGGKGLLSIKEMWQMPFVQIKLRAKSSDIAIAALNSAVDILINKHNADSDIIKDINQFSLKSYERKLTALVEEERKIQKISEAVRSLKRMSSDKSTEEINKLEREVQLLELQNSITDKFDLFESKILRVKNAMDINEMSRTKVFVPVTLEKPIIASIYSALALGALIGLIMCVLIILA